MSQHRNNVVNAQSAVLIDCAWRVAMRISGVDAIGSPSVEWQWWSRAYGDAAERRYD